MADDKYISNKTIVSNNNGALTITTYYLAPEDLELNFFISNQSQNIEGVSFTEGELGYTINNSTDYFSNIDGDLISVSDDPSKYSIVDGNLILTT